MDSKAIALRIVGLAKAKKAEHAVVLDMRSVCGFCDYFVIMSGASLRQVGSLARAIQEGLEKQNIRSLSKLLPNDESGWVVLDFSSVIVHIFYKPLREFYALEHLWSDASRVRIPSKLALA